MMISRVKKWCYAALVGITTVLVVVYTTWSVILYFTTYSPVLDAEATARNQMLLIGYHMEGYLGEIVDQPDRIGGCKVQMTFHDFSTQPPNSTARVA